MLRYPGKEQEAEGEPPGQLHNPRSTRRVAAGGEPLGSALLGSAAYLPLAPRNTGGFCAGPVGDKNGKGGHCKVPGFQRFLTQVLGSQPKEERDLRRAPAVRVG